MLYLKRQRRYYCRDLYSCLSPAADCLSLTAYAVLAFSFADSGSERWISPADFGG
jgi:hypothetical protein